MQVSQPPVLCVLSASLRFRRELQTLPALPEMVFSDSWLRLDHVSGCGLAFYALDALRRVDTTRDTLKVAAADDWSKTRWVSPGHVTLT